MPSVDPITPSSSTTAGATGLFGALVPQQVSGLFGELMAMVTGTLGEAVAATPSTGAEPTAATTDTGTTPTQTTGQRRRTLLDTDTGATDLAAALAVLAGGANQTPALSAALASPASLGAAGDGRSHTSDPSTAIGAPTAATGFATPTPASTTAATPATTTTSDTSTTVDGAAATATAPRISMPAAVPTPTPPVTDAAPSTPTTTGAPTSGLAASVAGSAGSAATTTTTAATTPTASAADRALPPALASAIAGATGVATMPGALRHLSGTRVSGATANGATTNGSTAAAASDAAATSTASATAGDAATKSTEAAASVGTPAPVIHTAAEPRSAGRGDTAVAPIHTETGRGLAEPREPAPEAPARPDAATSVSAADRPAGGIDPDRRERAGAEATTDDRAMLDQPLLAVTGETGRDRVAAAHTVREATTEATRTTTLAQLPEAIAARSSAGHSRFDIRLSPAELGSVDVRVEVRASGEVRAHLVVERTETLDLMLRDQKHLERSLSDAGLDVGSSGLQFSLRQQPSGESGQGWRTYDDATVRSERVADEEAETTVAPIAAAAYRSTRIGGVDLRV